MFEYCHSPPRRLTSQRQDGWGTVPRKHPTRLTEVEPTRGPTRLQPNICRGQRATALVAPFGFLSPWERKDGNRTTYEGRPARTYREDEPEWTLRSSTN